MGKYRGYGAMVDWGQAGHTEGFGREAREGALGGEQVPANVKYGQGPWSLEQRPREVGRTGLGIRKERPTWGSTVQGFLGMRRMADGPWGFVALS